MSMVGPRDVFAAEAASRAAVLATSSAVFDAAVEHPLLKQKGIENMQIMRLNRVNSDRIKMSSEIKI